MGKDGAEGLLRLREHGATTFAQDEATSVVYGMPKAAWENGAAQRRLSIHSAAEYIIQHHGRRQACTHGPGHTPMSNVTPPTQPTILVVDDEPVVLSALKQTLEREGFHVVACASPLKALAILHERDFSVIISDQKMPEMLGLDFLIESRTIRPRRPASS
jgi:chemotaxis response regulator CheB